MGAIFWVIVLGMIKCGDAFRIWNSIERGNLTKTDHNVSQLGDR